MKLLIFLIGLTPFMLNQGNDLIGITRAISDGNASALSQYFDQSVEIAVLEQENIYSKTQAVKVIDSFFSSNKPLSFSKVHEGTSKGSDSQYCIGNLRTNGSTFRVYIYAKSNAGKYLIQELRFDKE